ncbi:hypothetical protein RKE30_03885 [Streptomyces sp. Li-HN-5-11]|uniref:hypothetical protein n=1 Tax=Streptomyces sp. Li-HN-5-11 TaxID=3075432 RepID=UPI0028A6B161|nr:hypothetical protein [Streptomyces sp. Li-HN-5-11]WNM29592.1 hypothetical protein RKE30_03885 [Streptomyces sp. Li-HN-5-11]
MTWQDMDPATHPFDPKQAFDVVRQVVASPDPESGSPRGLWSTNSVARGLAEQYGSWAFGWYGAVGRSPDSGTVVKDLHVNDGDDELQYQARRYTSILLQWREWLEELAVIFSQFAPELDEPDALRRARERGVAPLVTLVVQRTGADELWLGVCAQALTWFLESTGISPAEAEELVDEVVDSEFRSWVSPGEDAVNRARERIGKHEG